MPDQADFQALDELISSEMANGISRPDALAAIVAVGFGDSGRETLQAYRYALLGDIAKKEESTQVLGGEDVEYIARATAVATALSDILAAWPTCVVCSATESSEWTIVEQDNPEGSEPGFYCNECALPMADRLLPEIPCPAPGCTGKIERITRYKVSAEWAREADGTWSLGAYDNGSRFHLFCSQGHELRRRGRDLPAEAQAVVFPAGERESEQPAERQRVRWGAPHGQKALDSHLTILRENETDD